MKNFITLALLAAGMVGVLHGVRDADNPEIEVLPTRSSSATPAPTPRPDAGRSSDDEDFVGTVARQSLNQMRPLSMDRMAVLKH